MNIGLTGGNGFIGSQLLQLLIDKGYNVTCLVRETSNLQWIDGLPVDFTYGDVRDTASLKRFVEGKDIIFHLAGMVKSRTEQEIIEVNAGGTGNLLEAAVRFDRNLKRFLFVSSQEAVGLIEGDDPWTEDVPPAPITAYGKSKAQAEEICKDYSTRVPITIIRPSPVYGPRDKETFIFFKLIAKGLAMIPNKKARISVIYSGNLVDGIHQAAFAKGSIGGTYFLADDTIDWYVLNDMIARELHKKPLKFLMPKFILKTGAGLVEFFHSLAGKSSMINRDKISMLTHTNLAVSNARAKKDFGYIQRTSLENSIRITAHWYRDNGWI